ncbi:hypothetical protein AD006_25455 [Pseudonocardia sp. EC080610-09]|uniref:hypothetical protein n=1 Tax=unclassified Pseudonocardia TaxID=2619320 RepID=UPI0006CB6E7E|nr:MULTISPECIES: hypothetical protein [unclassified Pseudonocardia]ALE74405.1 hypothetical protein FRP1_18010 [Pseudonocardia sp. EC080625-04]ALL77817.1 hypothetical protein AD006_25455 [Pseudonocardia sp. EC080610-09]ALL80733.1 hypothetical protein AD017_05045 [Pseudonocardia sp. EC080619-01]
MRELDVRDVARGTRETARGTRSAGPRERRRPVRPVCAGGGRSTAALRDADPVEDRAVPVAEGVRRLSAAERAALRWAGIERAEGGHDRPERTGRRTVHGVPVVPGAAPAWRTAGVPGRDRRPVAADPSSVPAPRTVRPLHRRCVAPARRRTRQAQAHSRGSRLLAGVAVALCAATAVVVLGLLGDAAAGWNAGGATAPASPAGPVVTAATGR